MARPEGTELRPKEARAIAALLCEPTVEAAARTARVSVRTLARWLRRPDFAEELAHAAREAMASAMKSLQAASVEAMEALRVIVTDPDAPATTRVSAARIVLDQSQRATERNGLEARIVDLEREVEERGLAEDHRWP